MKNSIMLDETFLQRAKFLFLCVVLECSLYISGSVFRWRDGYYIHEGWLDRMIPFNPYSIIPYFSLYILIPLAFFKCQPKKIITLTNGFCLISLMATSIYFIFPTTINRVGVVENSGFLYIFIGLFYQIDTSFNCFPSQHCALAILCTACLMATDKLINSMYFLWCLLILWSTVAVRQHLAIDLIGGIFLGLSIYFIVLVLEKNHG